MTTYEGHAHKPRRREKRPARPLDEARLEELALAYVARFSTSAGKLEAYLKRKLRERGWDGSSDPAPAGIVARYVDLGYVDDAGYARARAGGLLRRGYGQRRIEQALYAAGIAEEIRDEVKPSEGRQRRAALALGRKRRFGPFAAERPDRAMREKQIAAMLRAGHAFDIARPLVDAPSELVAEQWAAEAMDGEELE